MMIYLLKGQLNDIQLYWMDNFSFSLTRFIEWMTSIFFQGNSKKHTDKRIEREQTSWLRLHRILVDNVSQFDVNYATERTQANTKFMVFFVWFHHYFQLSWRKRIVMKKLFDKWYDSSLKIKWFHSARFQVSNNKFRMELYGMIIDYAHKFLGCKLFCSPKLIRTDIDLLQSYINKWKLAHRRTLGEWRLWKKYRNKKVHHFLVSKDIGILAVIQVSGTLYCFSI